MRSLSRIALAAWATAMLCGMPAASSADDGTGTYRISDSKTVAEPNYLPASHNTVHQGQCEYGGRGGGWHSHGQYGHGHWHINPISGTPMHPYVKGAVWLPSIHPVQREPVIYQRWWPRRWYGMPGGGIAKDAMRAPVIYQPTDTTQLGFYHQRVPFWTPRPGQYPTAAPNPNMLHNYTRPPLGYRWYYSSYYWGNHHGSQNGQVIDTKDAPADKKAAPNKDDRPTVPEKLDKSALKPQIDPIN